MQSLTDVPLSIDSSIVAALEAGLAVYQGKPLVNSVTGEDERLEQVLPLVAKYGAAVVAITNDETGISEDPDVRFAVAEKIVHRAADHGIAERGHRRRSARDADRRDGHGGSAGVRAGAAAARRARRELDLRRVERQLRSAEPQRAQRRVPGDGDRERHDVARSRARCTTEVRQAVMAADVMMGNDPDCQAWIARFREQPAGAGGGRRGGRAGRRGASADALEAPPAP